MHGGLVTSLLRQICVRLGAAGGVAHDGTCYDDDASGKLSVADDAGPSANGMLAENGDAGCCGSARLAVDSSHRGEGGIQGASGGADDAGGGGNEGTLAEEGASRGARLLGAGAGNSLRHGGGVGGG